MVTSDCFDLFKYNDPRTLHCTSLPTGIMLTITPTQCDKYNALVPPQYLNRKPAVNAEHFGLRLWKHLLKPLFHHLRESTGPRIITCSHKLQHWNIETRSAYIKMTLTKLFMVGFLFFNSYDLILTVWPNLDADEPCNIVIFCSDVECLHFFISQS